MTDTHQKEENCTPDLVERLHTVTAMLEMGEKVSLTYEVALIETAAAEIKRLRAKLAEAEEDRDKWRDAALLSDCEEQLAECADGMGAERELKLLARAELAEAQLSHLEMANLFNDERARAAEKRLAGARAVIAPLVNRYNEIMQITRGRRWATYVEMDHLRAAAEWMEANR